jgi:murein DD-endopeptidase MepM/ murein hydrolase activator NlpD
LPLFSGIRNDNLVLRMNIIFLIFHDLFYYKRLSFLNHCSNFAANCCIFSNFAPHYDNKVLIKIVFALTSRLALFAFIAGLFIGSLFTVFFISSTDKIKVSTSNLAAAQTLSNLNQAAELSDKTALAAKNLEEQLPAGDTIGLEENEPDNEETLPIAEEPLTENELLDETQVEAAERFGVNPTIYQIQKYKIGKNELLPTLLKKNALPAPWLEATIAAIKNIFDARNLKSGHDYWTLKNPDTGNLQTLIYEESPAKYLSLTFYPDTTVGVSYCEYPSETKTIAGAGIIKGSLYESLEKAGLDAEVAVYLGKIFQWQIDFFHIQENDEFKIIYDAVYANDNLMAIAKIHAAYIKHKGEDFYAFPFNTTPNEDNSDYYDEKGKSLKQAFLKSPLKYSRISSRYSHRRLHPVTGRFKGHFGTDYAAPKGTPIRTIGDGVVLQASRTRGNGNFVKIKHNNTYTTQYLHLSKFAKGMRRGKRLKQGEIIGYVGSTGLATGPHLCFRFWKNGRQVDHLRERLPMANPVPKKQKESYLNYVTNFQQALDTIGNTNYNSVAIQQTKQAAPNPLKASTL